jgi:twitching motility protein PilT
VIPFGIKGFEELNLPMDVMERIANEGRGLVLLTGTTGSGKSTTLAAMIDHINHTRRSHIITIEDPIEFLHRDHKGIISQREIGTDTDNFAQALKMALRQDPDVILVGEMRDFETIETAILAAETGHLVLSTLHTLDAAETVNRIVAVYPPYQQKQIRLQLAGILKGVVSQRLLPRADGMGRVPAVEIMISTARIRECIVDKEKTLEIYEAISEGLATYHMQTFDQSLMSLLRRELITYEEALRHSSNPDDFALRVKGILATSDMTWDEFDKVAQESTEEEEPEVEKY